MVVILELPALPILTFSLSRPAAHLQFRLLLFLTLDVIGLFKRRAKMKSDPTPWRGWDADSTYDFLDDASVLTMMYGGPTVGQRW
jgi:hypothetical protein